MWKPVFLNRGCLPGLPWRQTFGKHALHYWLPVFIWVTNNLKAYIWLSRFCLGKTTCQRSFNFYGRRFGSLVYALTTNPLENMSFVNSRQQYIHDIQLLSWRANFWSLFKFEQSVQYNWILQIYCLTWKKTWENIPSLLLLTLLFRCNEWVSDKHIPRILWQQIYVCFSSLLVEMC